MGRIGRAICDHASEVGDGALETRVDVDRRRPAEEARSDAGPPGACYRALVAGQPERVDVIFGGNVTVWGERASEFEEIPADKIQ